jgi:hypothetical protein
MVILEADGTDHKQVPMTPIEPSRRGLVLELAAQLRREVKECPTAWLILRTAITRRKSARADGLNTMRAGRAYPCHAPRVTSFVEGRNS